MVSDIRSVVELSGATSNKYFSAGILQKVYVGVLLVIFGGIVLHAPISVGFGSLFPDYELIIKSWKEILMGVALILAGVLMYRNERFDILKNPLIIAIGVYAVLHLLSLTVANEGFVATSAGLMLDLRYLLYFVLVYIAIKLYPQYAKSFIRVGVAGALVVLVFAVLQVFILPVDVLKHIGYGADTISPYLTVDQNHDFIRINSTLRGPNPLGAYAVIALSLLFARAIYKKIKLTPAFITLLVGGGVALWASYSRSAWLAAAASGAVLFAFLLKQAKVNRRWLAIGTASAVILLGGLFLARDTSFVSNIILHENPGESNIVNSNEGHVDSLQDGWGRFISQPLGAGVGSTGSASLLGADPFIIENQYFYTAHEAGWLGLGLFMMIFIGVMSRLWAARQRWLALGLFASGLGMAIIGLVLPVWVDDTVAIIWWGAAALAISYWSTEKRGVSHGKQID